MTDPTTPGRLVLSILPAVMILCGTAAGQPADTASGPAAEGTLVVGTKSAPPFVMREADGAWSGISIELWRSIADDLGLAYELREMELEELLAGVADGSLDAAVAALTVTAERELAFDFTHPFYSAGLGIAVRPAGGARWTAAARRLLSVRFLMVLGALTLLLLGVGAAVWLLERKRNAGQFGGGAGRGIGSGFWWSAVTMTTVGYGDKAPVTFGGRLVALVWMFAGIILISSFTAAITSALTVTELGSIVRGPDDLPRVRVVSVAGTTSERYLRGRGIAHRALPTPREALRAVEEGRADAAVYDAPILRHLARSDASAAVRVLSTSFERQDYAIGLPADSPLREPINRALLRATDTPEWAELRRRYLGEE